MWMAGASVSSSSMGSTRTKRRRCRAAYPAVCGSIRVRMSETQFYVSVAVLPPVTVIIVLVGVLLNNTNNVMLGPLAVAIIHTFWVLRRL